MLREFKQFLLRGNVVDLAVGIVIGGAFNVVVMALVKDFITPLVGAIFSVPLARVRSVDELPGERVALVARAGQPLRGRAAATIVVGAERTGLPDEVVAACERIAHIPIASESLNAAMAATIALYELTRP